MGQAESHAADAGGPGATQAAGSGGQDKDAVEFLTQALSFGSCTAPCKGVRAGVRACGRAPRAGGCSGRRARECIHAHRPRAARAYLLVGHLRRPAQCEQR